MTKALLQVTDLKKHYPVRAGVLRRQVGTVHSVDGVSFSLGAGETLGLVGESGCSKSTLGRAVLQLRPALSGRVVFDSEDLTSMRGEALRKMRRRVRAAIADRAALGLPFPHPLPPRGPEMRERGAGTTSGQPAPVRRLPSPADVNKDKRKRKRRE